MTTTDPVNDNSDPVARARDLEEELIDEIAKAEAAEAMQRTTAAGERLAAFAEELATAGSAARDNGRSVAAAIAAVPPPAAEKSAPRSI